MLTTKNQYLFEKKLVLDIYYISLNLTVVILV